MVRTFPEKAQVAVDHFQRIFREPEGCSITDILEVTILFPRIITNEMNEELTKDIMEEEIQHILRSFQKGKIPGSDGLTLEFFLGLDACGCTCRAVVLPSDSQLSSIHLSKDGKMLTKRVSC